MDTLKGEELKRKKTIVHCWWSLYLSLRPFVPWITLFSSQACLFLVSLLLRDGGLKWWRPMWGTQFLRFIDMPTEVVYIVISVLYQYKYIFLSNNVYLNEYLIHQMISNAYMLLIIYVRVEITQLYIVCFSCLLNVEEAIYQFKLKLESSTGIYINHPE